MTRDTLTETADLEALYGEPSSLARDKVLAALDRHCRALIAASPFLVLATAAADGRVDASPRGDAPGFVEVPDETTVLIPDRPGNRRVDSMRNVVTNPRVGLIFFVPGMNETLRINGRAEIVTEAALLTTFAVRGRAPLSVLRVTVEEAFLHCAKALVRSDLWNAEKFVDRRDFPTLGKMLADQRQGLDPNAAEALVQESLRTKLY